jgi:Domain of unknown function (DUF5666)
MDSIAGGDGIEVHGFADVDGSIRATRVEKKSGQGDEFEIKGFVSDLAADAGTFTLKVTPTAAASYGVELVPGVSLPAGIANGSEVEVRTEQPLAPGPVIIASSVKLDDDLGGDDENHDNVNFEVEGLATSGDAGTFMIGNQSVVTDANTEFDGGAATDVVAGAAVEVEGSLDASNVLHAKKVEFDDSARLQAVPANLTSTDAHTGTFTLLGVLVHVSPFTEFKDSHGNPVDLTTLGTSAVMVRGSVLHGTDVVASRLELTDDARLEIRGPVSAMDATAGTLVILGLTVDLNSAEFEGHGGASTAAAFLAMVQLGNLVDATGDGPSTLAGTVLTAHEVSLEDDN